MKKTVDRLRIEAGKAKRLVRSKIKTGTHQIKQTYQRATRPRDPLLIRAQILKKQGQYEKALSLLNTALTPLSKETPVKQKTLVRWLAISNERAEISILLRTKNASSYKASIKEYLRRKKTRPNTQPRIAIYTAISGGYDTIKPPAILDPRFDYIIFTDTPVDNPGYYDVRPLPYVDYDATRSARYVKTNPHKLLASEYDVAVWVDANIMLLGDIYPFIEQTLNKNVAVGAIPHALRDNIYEEADECLKASKGNPDSIKNQVAFYKKVKYNSKLMLETNFLIYNLRQKSLTQFLTEWWNQIDTYSNRDQLSVGYALDTHDTTWTNILEKPNTTRNTPVFSLTRHGQAISEQISNLMRSLNAKKTNPLKSITNKTTNTNIHTDIVYCVHNALPDVKRCLSSVKKYLEANTQLIIVNDGSDEKTSKYLRNFTKENSSWTSITHNKKATGYTSAASQGMKLSRADFVILLNSDTIVTKGWVGKLLACAFSDESIGIVGPLSSAASHQSIPDHQNSDHQTATNSLPKGVTPASMNKLCEDSSGTQPYIRVPLVHGFCFGVKRSVIDTIGYFDRKKFPRGYGEENDYCFRAANAGFSLALTLNTYIYHAKSKSFVGPERLELMRAGMQKNIESYGQQRISRAVRTMDNHPRLITMRRLAESLYE